MRTEDLKWSKTRVECPYCGGWFTRQGIGGHIRFRHPERRSDESDALDEFTKSNYRSMYLEGLGMMERDLRLTTKLREYLLDRMLLDFLEKLARGKT